MKNCSYNACKCIAGVTGCLADFHVESFFFTAVETSGFSIGFSVIEKFFYTFLLVSSLNI